MANLRPPDPFDLKLAHGLLIREQAFQLRGRQGIQVDLLGHLGPAWADTS